MSPYNAISWLKSIDEKYIHGGDEDYDKKRKEAIAMAIQSLEEHKQGEWYMRGGKWTCPNCEERALLKEDNCTGGSREYIYYRSNFCPNCGADMRGSKNDNGDL